MRRLQILHRTHYRFAGAVRLGPHRLLVRPREGPELRIESSLLETTPPATLRWLRDAHDNSVAIASFEQPATELIIRSGVVVQHYGETPLDFLVADAAVNYPFRYDADTAALLRPYLLDLKTSAERESLWQWVGGFWRYGDQMQTFSLLERLCLGIKQTFRYQMREEPGVQTASETLQLGSGSCRDFAALFLEAVRSLHLAARFVSGYLHAQSAGGGATHAWVEVYLPGAGWKGFDPTLGEVVGSKHIPVAVARCPDAVSPVVGSFFGDPGASLEVEVRVSELQS